MYEIELSMHVCDMSIHFKFVHVYSDHIKMECEKFHLLTFIHQSPSNFIVVYSQLNLVGWLFVCKKRAQMEHKTFIERAIESYLFFININ